MIISGILKRITSAAVAVCASLILLASCGGAGNGVQEPDQPPEGGIGAVPAGVDLGGRTFTLLCRENGDRAGYAELEADGDSADALDRAIYQREIAVEDALNVKIKTKVSAASASDYSYLIKNNVLSGTGTYDAIAGGQDVISSPSLAGLLLNIYDLPYLGGDLDALYFSPDLADELTVDGKLFYLAGDCTVSLLGKTNVLFFNEKTAKLEKIDDLYQLVRDGEWTADKLAEITRGLYMDLNGNGRSDLGDRFGYTTDCVNTADSLFVQFGIMPTSKDDNGNVVLSVDRGKTVSVLEKAIDFFGTSDVYAYRAYGQSADDGGQFYDIFTSGRALFYAGALSFARECRDGNVDYGILPLPKWDAAQEQYLTQPQGGYTVISVPSDAPDAELSGAVLDALFAESSNTVIPAYYDVVLNSDDDGDSDSAEMLDFIRAGIRLDLGFFHEIGLSGLLCEMLSTGNSNFVSSYASHAREYERALDNVLKQIYGIEE